MEAGPAEPKPVYAAAAAIAAQIEGDELRARDRGAFEAECERVLAIQRALIDLASICEEGRRSGMPSSKPWLNDEAWQNAYVALAARISDGRVDIERPLGGLAFTTARNFFRTEHRRQRRFAELSDEQLWRLAASEERPVEDAAEASRRGEVLRRQLARLVGSGKLNEADLTILRRRYVDEWSASEVAGSARLRVDNVRQICARRCRLLRRELGGRGIEDVA